MHTDIQYKPEKPFFPSFLYLVLDWNGSHINFPKPQSIVTMVNVIIGDTYYLHNQRPTNPTLMAYPVIEVLFIPSDNLASPNLETYLPETTIIF